MVPRDSLVYNATPLLEGPGREKEQEEREGEGEWHGDGREAC